MRDIISYEQLVQINLTLQKENDLLKQENTSLKESLDEIKKYYQSFDKFAATVYDPKKSTYKELEEKVAKADEIRKKDIDELWETRITPLQNKVKDQHIQLESTYKRETKYQQQIKDLEQTRDDQNTVINYMAGYISACEQFKNKHPTTVKTWFFNGWKDEV